MSNRAWRLALPWVAGLLAGLLLAVPSICFAQQATRAGWVTDTIHSGVLGQRPIYVATPAGYEVGQAQYPILVLLDADDHPMFQLWLAQSSYLASNSPAVPPMIVVGIPNGDDRIHDMTPGATGTSAATFKTAGGAPAFAAFVIGEVLPHVRARYRTQASAILAGHSVAGLFAIDVAARRPGVFQGVIAMDPSLQFNDATLIDPYASLLSRSRTQTRLFVSSREDDEVLPRACRRFAAILAANGSLGGRFFYRAYPGATHELVPMSFADGLQFIFEPMSPSHLAVQHLNLATVDSQTLNVALRSSDSAYATAARSLGLSEQLPEDILNDLGYVLLEHGKASLAILIFKRNAELHSESQNVYDSLGDGFLAAADTVSALGAFRRALEAAHRTGVPVNPDTQRKLRALEARP